MTSPSSDTGSADGYDVYISYPRAEAAWAQLLYRDLSELGLECFFDRDLAAGKSLPDESEDSLDRSGALVVLWSAEARGSNWIGTELARFGARPNKTRDPLPVIPLILGDADLLGIAPKELSSRQAVIVGHDAYRAGPEADTQEWHAAVQEIAKRLEPNALRRRFRRSVRRSRTSGVDVGRPSQASAEEAPGAQPGSPSLQVAHPILSGGASQALTLATQMVGSDGTPQRIRTAVLLGALLTSARTGMTPTTGDVVRLILSKHSGSVTAEEILVAAGRAAGLREPALVSPPDMATEELAQASLGELLPQLKDMQRRTASDRVHLRHVLAAGIDRLVAKSALTELGTTLKEVVDEWLVSIARTWPRESQDGWRKLLEERLATAPPSARVHADRWTTDDSLDYGLYARAIAEFIVHPEAEPPMVISVQGPWGQGKTSLMRMIQQRLDPQHPDLASSDADIGLDLVEPPSALSFGELRDSLDGELPADLPKPDRIRTVWFNAWKYQNSEEVWAGLAHSILAQLPSRLPAKDRELFWLRLQLRRIDPGAVREDIHRAVVERFLPRLAGWAILILGTVVIAGVAVAVGRSSALGVTISGGGLLGALWFARHAWAKATEEALKRPLEGAYLRYVSQPDYATRLGYLHLVEEDMRRALGLLTPDTGPAVIFIDDLDRCSPAKVGEVIEAMNLFLAGDYPKCAFVVGMDAEVVAASMEVVHAELIAKLADRRGELGWRFMDKFVQLPFVMPRLDSGQRENYLRGLFSTSEAGDSTELVAQADLIEKAVATPGTSVDDLAKRVGQLAPQLAKVDPDRALALGEKVVSAGARAFSDSDDEVIQALADQIPYLSDNPRTIKRAVNLYRFHRFAAFARQASAQSVKVATPEQIGRWIVLIIRWPQFVRWLQAQGDAEDNTRGHVAALVFALARDSETHLLFNSGIEEAAIEASWSDDPELWAFLHAETTPDLRLELAASCGLW